MPTDRLLDLAIIGGGLGGLVDLRYAREAVWTPSCSSDAAASAGAGASCRHGRT